MVTYGPEDCKVVGPTAKSVGKSNICIQDSFQEGSSLAFSTLEEFKNMTMLLNIIDTDNMCIISAYMTTTGPHNESEILFVYTPCCTPKKRSAQGDTDAAD